MMLGSWGDKQKTDEVINIVTYIRVLDDAGVLGGQAED